MRLLVEQKSGVEVSFSVPYSLCAPISLVSCLYAITASRELILCGYANYYRLTLGKVY